jgi:hypothetical protein
MLKYVLALFLFLAPTTELNLSKYTCMAPCYFDARVKIVPKEDDRYYEVTVDNGDFFSLSSDQIEVPDPPTKEFRLKAPYPGTYLVKVSVYNSTAKITYASSKQLIVNGE